MKVLLVTAKHTSQKGGIGSVLLTEPLGLEYIAAGVQDHHDVKFVDLRSDTEPGLKETLESFQPDIIGCGACTPDVNSTKQIMAEVKRISPDILTVVGGHHATVKPKDFFDETIDVVVVGEGVSPFRKICECHEKQKSFEDIENIYYRKNGTNGTNGQMVFTRNEPFPPLDSLPFPARSLTSHIRHKYNSFMLNKQMPIAQIMGSYGCIYHCKFCAVSDITGHKVYRRSIDKIIEELASIEEPLIYWVDDEIFLDPERAILLAREIGQAGIKKDYFILARADTIIKNPECLEEWAKICSQYVVGIGIESHKEEDLKKMRKGTTLAKNDESVRICKANNAKIRGGFIVQQYFEKSDFRGLLDYVRKLDVDIPIFTVWTPFPGTKLYEETKQDLITDNYDLFDMLHTVLPTKLPLKQFYKEYHRVFKNVFPLLKKIKALRKIDPQIRKEIISRTKNLYRQIKNAYRDYDKRLW